SPGEAREIDRRSYGRGEISIAEIAMCAAWLRSAARASHARFPGHRGSPAPPECDLAPGSIQPVWCWDQAPRRSYRATMGPAVPVRRIVPLPVTARGRAAGTVSPAGRPVAKAQAGVAATRAPGPAARLQSDGSTSSVVPADRTCAASV